MERACEVLLRRKCCFDCVSSGEKNLGQSLKTSFQMAGNEREKVKLKLYGDL